MTRQFETVFDVQSELGADKSSARCIPATTTWFHSATLAALPTTRRSGPRYQRHEDLPVFSKIAFNECHVDKSGRWLMSLEDVDFSTTWRCASHLQRGTKGWSGTRRAPSTSRQEYVYVVGADTGTSFPNAFLLWTFPRIPSPDFWSRTTPSGRRRLRITSPRQRASGPAVGTVSTLCAAAPRAPTAVWSNEIICFRLDGSLDVLVWPRPDRSRRPGAATTTGRSRRETST